MKTIDFLFFMLYFLIRKIIDKKNETDIRQYFVGGMMSICDGKVAYHDVMWEHQIQQEFDSYLLDNWLSKEKFFK